MSEIMQALECFPENLKFHFFSQSILFMATNTMQPKEAAISDVLNQNIEVLEQIKTSANELEVVHAVLSTKVRTQGAGGDLQAAVQRTSEVEQQLNETAEALDRSNKLLSEIDLNKIASS